MPKPVASIWANGAQVDANHPAVAEAERLGAVIGRENPGRALIPNEYWYRIGGNANGQYDPQQFARPFKPTNQFEYDQMPAGTEYHDRQNKLQKKPGASPPQPAPAAPADYKQFREPGSGRTPALLKEMQTGGMMPKDMQLSRFMTMPSPDYLGTLNENTAPKTGTPVMAKNRLPTASLEQLLSDAIMQDMVNRNPGAPGGMQDMVNRRSLPPAPAAKAAPAATPPQASPPQFAPPTMPYDASGVGSLFDQDPQMLMHKDRGHNLVRQGLDSVPGGLDPSLFEVPGPARDTGGALSRAMTDDPGPAYMGDFHRPVPRSHEYEIPTPLIDSEPVQVQRKNWGPLTERDMHEKYYADRAGLPWQPRLPQVSPAPEPGSYTPTDPNQLRADFQAIRQQGRDSAAAEVAKREAETERMRTQGGSFSNGNGYVSLRPGSWTAEAQAEVDNFAANNPRPSPTTLNRLPVNYAGSGSRPAPQAADSGSYVPAGDMSQIESNRQYAVLDRRMNLLNQGKTDDEVDRIMFPQRFAQPKDPAIEQAKAIDAAERQGRSNLHAIAQKFRRNGLPIDQAYAAAMNTIQTTNPANKGAVPSLPGMDPLRVIGSVGGSAGTAAGAYGVGLANAQNALTLGNQTSADNRYGVDSRERVGLAQAQNNFIQGLLENAQKEAELRMNQGVVNSETSAAQQARNLEVIKMMREQGVHNLPQGHPDRAVYDKLWQDMMGSPSPGGGGAPAPAPGDGGAPAPVGAPTSAPVDQFQHYANNPAAMNQYLSQFDTDSQPGERARALARGGAGTHPAVRDYIVERYNKEDPNLTFGLPDRWTTPTNESSNSVSWLPWAFGQESRAAKGAKYVAQNYGIPYDVALPIMTQHFDQNPGFW